MNCPAGADEGPIGKTPRDLPSLAHPMLTVVDGEEKNVEALEHGGRPTSQALQPP